MNKLLNDFKKNKYTTIAIVIFILLIFAGYGVYNLLVPNKGTPVYGNRLEGIEEVSISDSDLERLNEDLEKDDKVVKASSNVNGRIVNVILTIKEGVKEKDAKSLTSIITKHFTEEQLEYFDFELYLTTEDDSYNIIGYKNKTEEDFVF